MPKDYQTKAKITPKIKVKGDKPLKESSENKRGIELNSKISKRAPRNATLLDEQRKKLRFFKLRFSF